MFCVPATTALPVKLPEIKLYTPPTIVEWEGPSITLKDLVTSLFIEDVSSTLPDIILYSPPNIEELFPPFIKVPFEFTVILFIFVP